MSLNNNSEKVSTNKKKVSIYLLLVVVTILFFLGFLTIKNIFSNNNKTSDTTLWDNSEIKENDYEKEKSNTSKNDFDKLINSTRPYNNHQIKSNKNDNEKESEYKYKDNKNIVIDQNNRSPVVISNPYDKKISDINFGKNLNDLKKDLVSNYREQEKLRGLMSNRAKWIDNNNMNNKQNPKKIEATNKITDDIKSLSLDTKRQQTRKKIEEIENKIVRLNHYKESGQISKLEQTASDIEFENKTFKNPPVDVVGYTKENIYDADIKNKFKIPVGTVISAFTTMKTISDYQGTFKAMVDHDIYDSTNRYILVPKGTEFLIKSIKASNVNEILESRMGYLVTWAVLPNGNKIDFSKSSGLDHEGIGAVKDKVDHHFYSQFFGVAAYALISQQSSRSSTNYNSETTFAGDIGEGLRGQARPLAQKYINVVPSITIDAGKPLRIITEDEIYVEAWRDLYEKFY